MMQEVKYGRRLHSCILPMVAAICAFTSAAAEVPYRVASEYEDTVRIAILWRSDYNNYCPSDRYLRCQQFVLSALSQMDVRTVHIKSVPEESAGLWSGKNPHVVVRINGGEPNGEYARYTNSFRVWMDTNAIGFVDIGDENQGTDSIFGWRFIYPVAPPIFSASWLNKPGDSLWMALNAINDVDVDSSQYPYLTGVISNATHRIANGNSRFFFSPYQQGRCDVDPDSMFVADAVAAKLSTLGYLQGWNAVAEPTDSWWYDLWTPVNQGLVGAKDKFPLVTVRVDTLHRSGLKCIRRSLALSFSPHYLQDTIAAKQIVYDATMFASLSHLEAPTKGSRAQRAANKPPSKKTGSLQVDGAARKPSVKQSGSQYDTSGRRVQQESRKKAPVQPSVIPGQ